ncbi:hypothetical protein HZH68_005252 [Vespula germanica]|uniref:Uncharacterized protein n=1 Tax=Vespula germanica TaxID=30212 RepID=A0A834KFQ4_VESGE|nr:hypothetical protein HZH68_005252 [Vespula germanica]
MSNQHLSNAESIDFKVKSSLAPESPDAATSTGETWIGSTCDLSKYKSRFYKVSTTGRMAAYFGAFQNHFLSISN